MSEYTTEIEIARGILTQAKAKLTDELGALGFSVSGSVHHSIDQAQKPVTILLTASLTYDRAVGDYILKATDTLGRCTDDDHAWVEEEDDEGEPYDRCLTCKAIKWL